MYSCVYYIALLNIMIRDGVDVVTQRMLWCIVSPQTHTEVITDSLESDVLNRELLTHALSVYTAYNTNGSINEQALYYAYNIHIYIRAQEVSTTTITENVTNIAFCKQLIIPQTSTDTSQGIIYNKYHPSREYNVFTIITNIRTLYSKLYKNTKLTMVSNDIKWVLRESTWRPYGTHDTFEQNSILSYMYTYIQKRLRNKPSICIRSELPQVTKNKPHAQVSSTLQYGVFISQRPITYTALIPEATIRNIQSNNTILHIVQM